MKHLSILTFLFVLTSIHSFGQSKLDGLEAELDKLAAATPLSGFSVSYFNEDELLYSSAHGMADLASKEALRTDHIQLIASITKTMIGVAAMQCVEQGILDLDADINNYLPFEVRNPNHPATPITMRQLATHTSSIAFVIPDEDKIDFTEERIADGKKGKIKSFLKKCEAVGDIDFRTYLKDRLTIGGGAFKKKHYFKEAPGKRYFYSNMGATLAAYIIEQQTGLSFSSYVKENILLPLGMTRSSFDPLDLDTAAISTPYISKKSIPVPLYSHRLYPIGGLYTTLTDLRVFAQDILKGSQGAGKLMSAESYQDMLAPQFDAAALPSKLSSNEPNMGIFWVHKSSGFIGHTGGGLGVSTFLFFDPETREGRIIFFNCDIGSSKEYVNSFKKVWTTVDNALSE